MIELEKDYDLSNYMNNEMIHLIKGFFGDKFKRRSSFISGKQLKGIVLQEVTKEVYANPDKYTTFASVTSLAGDLVLTYSSSLNGIALDKLVESVRSRLAVLDNKRINEGKESEFND